MINSLDFQRLITSISARIKTLEANQRSEQAGGVRPVYSASIGSVIRAPGTVIFLTNGCKIGEATGHGTGVLAYADASSWRRCSDDTLLTA